MTDRKMTDAKWMHAFYSVCDELGVEELSYSELQIVIAEKAAGNTPRRVALTMFGSIEK